MLLHKGIQCQLTDTKNGRIPDIREKRLPGDPPDLIRAKVEMQPGQEYVVVWNAKSTSYITAWCQVWTKSPRARKETLAVATYMDDKKSLTQTRTSKKYMQIQCLKVARTGCSGSLGIARLEIRRVRNMVATCDGKTTRAEYDAVDDPGLGMRPYVTFEFEFEVSSPDGGESDGDELEACPEDEDHPDQDRSPPIGKQPRTTLGESSTAGRREVGATVTSANNASDARRVISPPSSIRVENSIRRINRSLERPVMSSPDTHHATEDHSTSKRKRPEPEERTPSRNEVERTTNIGVDNERNGLISTSPPSADLHVQRATIVAPMRSCSTVARSPPGSVSSVQSNIYKEPSQISKRKRQELERAKQATSNDDPEEIQEVDEPEEWKRNLRRKKINDEREVKLRSQERQLEEEEEQVRELELQAKEQEIARRKEALLRRKLALQKSSSTPDHKRSQF